MRSALVVCLASFVLAACADQTGILVQISSTDIAVPADVDGLTIRAHTPDGLMVDQSFAIRSSWPQSLLVRPARGEALGEVKIEVTGTLGGGFVVRRVVMTAFTPGQVRTVDVQLTRDCLHVMCPSDIDCVAGTCQGVSPDAGMPDAGPTDAGTHDAGADAPAIADAGSDAGSDAGHDAGSDGGSDGGNDAGNDAAMPCAAASCLGHVVISEVATYMSNEFVELYNRAGTTSDLGGCTLEYFGGGMWQTRATLAAGTTLAPHGYYLLGNVGYTGTPAPDVRPWNTGFLDVDAALRLSCAGTVLDELGYGSGATQHEGTAAPAIGAATLPTGSYERKARSDSTAATMAAGGRDATAGNGWDSDDNASDFVIRTTRDPQSSASPPEP